MAAAVLRPVVSLARALVLLLAIVALASCARGISGHHRAPIPGDNDPHPGVDRARALPIQGLDVARYQGPIDFAAARAAGTHFVFIKGTEGKDYIDPNFYANWERARAAGVARGAYHFMTWCSRAADQAAWFVKMIPSDRDALPPVLDLEWNNHSKCRNKHDRAEILEKISVMLAAMEAHTGKVPIIYTDIPFYRDVLQGVRFDNPLWLRSVAAEPHERYDRHDWLFWQWTQTGTMRGVPGEVDRNAFYGSPDEWVAFLLTGCDPRLIERLGPEGRCQAK